MMPMSPGSRIFSTPLAFNLTWNVELLVATLRVSIARLGYSLPSTVTIRGSRRFTPSISGSVLVVPTPTAEFSSTDILAIMPGYLTMVLRCSGPNTADPGTRGSFLVCCAGTLLNTTGYFFIVSANIKSLPLRSGSGISTLNTTKPAPLSYKSLMILPYTSRGNGHCPYCSKLFSSILTVYMLFCVAVLPVIRVSKYLRRTLSTNAGSAILTVRINIKVMIAVQGLTHFIIWVFIV